jgi:hypothetical protein
MMCALLIAIIARFASASLSNASISAGQLPVIALLNAFTHSALPGLPLFILCLRLEILEWRLGAAAGALIGQPMPLIFLLNGCPSLPFGAFRS